MRWAVGIVCALALMAAPAQAGPPGTWESRTPAPLPRQEAAFAEVGGKLHLIGGFEYGAADSARHDVYDPLADSWTPALPLPQPEHHVQAAAIDGTLYVVGGLQTLGFVPSGRLYAFDGTAWSLRAGLPAGRVRGGGAAVASGGRLYYVGGLPSGSEATAMVDVYDPATDAWTALPDMPTPRDHLGVAVVGGTLYAVGGRQAAFETEVAATEALDLASKTWVGGLAPIPTKRGGFATAAVDGRIIAIGGESAEGVHDEVEAYDPATDRWTTLAPMPLPRHGIQGISYAGGAWVAGGGTDLNVAATASIDVFRPPPRTAAPAPQTQPGAPPVPPAAAAVKPRLRIVRARRGSRRVVLRYLSPKVETIVLRSRGRVVGRVRIGGREQERRLVVRLRRPLGRGTLTVSAAGLVRRVRVR